MKTVGIDLRCLPADGTDGAGIAHATRFLMQELCGRQVDWKWILYLQQGAKVEASHPKIHISNSSGKALRSALRFYPCDLLFVPSGACAPFISIPQIPWVHDLAIFDHPEWFPESFVHRQITMRLFARGLERTSHLFSVSETTKKDIVRHLRIDPSRITVTSEGGDPVLASRSCTEKTSDDHGQFCVLVGTIEPRKNFNMICTLWEDVYAKTGKQLVIVGKKGWGDVEIKSTKSVRVIESADDEEKRRLIAYADIVLVPSWFEGFGLVALEGMQAESAVIVSNTGALPEVVGSDGICIAPDRPDLWKKEILRLLQNNVARQNLAKEGKKRSEAFTWQKTADIIFRGINSHVSDTPLLEE